MNNAELIGLGFVAREKPLKQTIRYCEKPVMYYRTDLWIHSDRVAWIVSELELLCRRLYPQYDCTMAQILALVHDDAEIITGDVQLSTKMRMTPAEQQTHYNSEKRAIGQLAANSPEEILGYSYRRLLLHALDKDCLEARIVSLADKLDAGIGESLHEIFGGNASFPRICRNYENILWGFAQKFPELEPLLACDHPLFRFAVNGDYEGIARNGNFHTRRSLGLPTEIAPYNYWRDMTVSYMGEEGVKRLIEVKELDNLIRVVTLPY